MGFFSDNNNTNETVWDAIKTVPVLGNVVSGVNVAQDLYGMATDDGEKQKADFRDLAQDGLGFVPGLGNALGLGSLMYDIIAPNDSAHDLADRLMGGKAGEPTCDPEAGGGYNPQCNANYAE